MFVLLLFVCHLLSVSAVFCSALGYFLHPLAQLLNKIDTPRWHMMLNWLSYKWCVASFGTIVLCLPESMVLPCLDLSAGTELSAPWTFRPAQVFLQVSLQSESLPQG